MKTIEMTMSDERGSLTIREEFDEDCTWKAIAYTFRKFLNAQGYEIRDDDLDDLVEHYISSAPSGEDLF